MPPLIIVVTETESDGEAWVRRRLAALTDAQLDRFVLASFLRTIARPDDPMVAFMAAAAQDEYDRRGLVDGVRLG